MAKNSLTNYLHKYSLLKLDYLPVQAPWYYVFHRIFILFALIVITIKAIICISVKLDHSTALMLGDYAIVWPKPHQFLIFINILWFCCAWCSIFLFQRTNVSPKKQFWFHSLSILNTNIYDWTRRSKSIIIYLFFCVLKSNLFLACICGWCLYIPVFGESQSIKQFFFISLASFNSAISGYCCTALCVNFSFIFAFYALNSGLKYERLASRFNSQVLTLSRSSVINKINRDFVQLLVGNQKANSFWTQLNSTIFLLTFIAQIPILYLIFFVPLTNFTKFAMVILGSLNFLCGQSITFLSGSFAKTKFVKCREQLIRVLIKRQDLPFYFKIQLILSFDYLIDHALFKIFGQFEFTQINYLLVSIQWLFLNLYHIYYCSLLMLVLIEHLSILMMNLDQKLSSTN